MHPGFIERIFITKKKCASSLSRSFPVDHFYTSKMETLQRNRKIKKERYRKLSTELMKNIQIIQKYLNKLVSRSNKIKQYINSLFSFYFILCLQK